MSSSQLDHSSPQIATHIYDQTKNNGRNLRGQVEIPIDHWAPQEIYYLRSFCKTSPGPGRCFELHLGFLNVLMDYDWNDYPAQKK